MSVKQSSAQITLRFFVMARWVLLALVGLGWSLQTASPGLFDRLLSWFPPPPEPRGTAAVVVLLVATNVWVMRSVLRRGRATTEIAGVHLLVDSVALTALLALSGGVSNAFTTMYFVPMTLATQLSPRWTWAVAATSLLGFAALFVLAPAAPMMHGPPGHEQHFMGHIRGMWVAFGMSAAFMTYFVHRIALSLSVQRAELARLRLAAAQDRQLAALGTLAAGAAHELGSPLGTVSMLVSDLGLMSEVERGEAIVTVKQELQRCKHILQQMSSPELRVRSLGVTAEPWPLARLATALHGATGEVRLHFEQDAAVQAGATTTQPHEVLGQIVRAVVANAADACQRRPGATGVRLRCAVEPGAAGQPDMVVITVRDDGTGMAPQAVAAAFDPFFSTKVEGEGMGLGLYLARAHLRALGGTIELESQPGRGTTAQVRFPRTEALRGASAHGEEAEEEARNVKGVVGA